MVYEYNEKSDKSKNHVKAFTGFVYFSTERTVKQDLPDESYYGGAFEIGLGVETGIERVMRGGSVELGIAYSPKTSFEHDVMVRGGHEPLHTVYERSRATAAIGVVKCFGKGTIQPLVRCGGYYVLHWGNKESRFYQSKQIVDLEWENTAFFGVYLGGGIQMPVGKHYARLHADFYKSIASASKVNMVKWGVTAEFVL